MYNESNKSGKIIGAASTALYALLVVALILWGRLAFDYEDVVQGMIVDFGVSENMGSGEVDPVVADDKTYQQPTATPKDQLATTQEVEEAPEMKEANSDTDPTVTVEEQKKVDIESKEANEEPKINQLALFPGNKVESTGVSEGTVDNTYGNQGHITGAESSAHLGVGNIDGFVPDWNLDGRKLINSPVIPKYKGQEKGTVVIRICVNAEGYVTSAEFRAQGSTVGASSPLVTEAKKSAMTARFNSGKHDFQFGTITFRYELHTR